MIWVFFWLGAYAISLLGAIVYRSQLSFWISTAVYLSAYPVTAWKIWVNRKIKAEGLDRPEQKTAEEEKAAVWPEEWTLISLMLFHKMFADDERECPFCPGPNRTRVRGRNYISHLRKHCKGEKSPFARLDHETTVCLLREVYQERFQEEKNA